MSSAEGRSRIIAGKRLLQLLAIARFGRLECHIEGSRSSLHLVEVRFLIRISRVPEEGHARQVRYGFFQDLQPFRGQTGAKLGGPRDVATRLCEARDEPGGQGIACAHHDNGDGRRCSLGSERRWRALGHDDVDFEPDELGRKRRPPLASPLGPSKLEGDVLALRVTEVAQSFSQWLPGQVGEKAYPRDRRRWLLRPGGERRGEETARHRREKRPSL